MRLKYRERERERERERCFKPDLSLSIEGFVVGIGMRN